LKNYGSSLLDVQFTLCRSRLAAAAGLQTQSGPTDVEVTTLFVLCSIFAYYNCDSTSIQLRFSYNEVIKLAIWLRLGFDLTMTKNECVNFFAELRGVIASRMAEAGSPYEHKKRTE